MSLVMSLIIVGAMTACSGRSDPKPLRLTVIGDSSAYGGFDCGGCRTYVDLYGSTLSRRLGRKVVVTNLSTHDSLDTPRLEQRISTNAAFGRGIAAADILIVAIGHNDTPWASDTDPCDGVTGDRVTWTKYTSGCVAAGARQTGDRLAAILAQAKHLRHGRPTVQLVTDVYNDWVDVDDSHVSVLGGPTVRPGSVGARTSRLVLDAYNAALCRAATGAGATCVDVYHAFNGTDGSRPSGDLLGPDYTHPSAAGHERIAELLAQVDVSAVT
jgi:lysophospholipase L1-like esterase